MSQLCNELMIYLEDRSVRVGVNCYNGLGVLHSGQMLYSSRDSYSQVKLGCNHLSSLPDLHEYIISIKNFM